MVLKVAFRVDASLQMGSGHVMRCLALADDLAAFGAQCMFICRRHPGHLMQTIREKHSCIELPTAANEYVQQCQSHLSIYEGWLGSPWEIDARQTSDALRGFQPDWVVVDHYAIGREWEQYVRAVCAKIFVVDDLGNRSHNCQLLLDQNLGRSRADYSALIPTECVTMTGPSFALLRQEFAAARSFSLARRSGGQVENILVTMGGADANNVTATVLRALGESALSPQCVVSVVLGQQNPWYAHVMEVASKLPLRTQILVNRSDMADLMANADLAIGAGGATSWERCCLGLPTILVTLAENQVAAAVALHGAGAALYVGGWERVAKTLPVAVDRLLRGGQLKAMGNAASAICDGLGVQRVLGQLRALAS